MDKRAKLAAYGMLLAATCLAPLSFGQQTKEPLTLTLAPPPNGLPNEVIVEIANRSPEALTIAFNPKDDMFVVYCPKGDEAHPLDSSWPENVDGIIAAGHDRPLEWFELQPNEKRTYPFTIPFRMFDGNGNSEPIPVGTYLVNGWASVARRTEGKKMSFIRASSERIPVVVPGGATTRPATRPSN